MTLGYELVSAAVAARPSDRAGRRRRARKRLLRGARGCAVARRARRACPGSIPSRPRASGRFAAPSTASSPSWQGGDLDQRSGQPLVTAPVHVALGGRGRTASPTGSSTMRPTTGSLSCEAMLASGGIPVVVDEQTLAEANALARGTTGIAVDATGSAGLAGLLDLCSAGDVGVTNASLFSSRASPASPVRNRRKEQHEELPRQGHPVAQRL